MFPGRTYQLCYILSNWGGIGGWWWLYMVYILSSEMHLFLCHIETCPQAIMLRPMEAEVSCRESLSKNSGFVWGRPCQGSPESPGFLWIPDTWCLAWSTVTTLKRTVEWSVLVSFSFPCCDNNAFHYYITCHPGVYRALSQPPAHWNLTCCEEGTAGIFISILN